MFKGRFLSLCVLAQGPLLLLSLRLQDDGGAGAGADRHDLLHRGIEVPLQRVLRRRQSCGELARSLQPVFVPQSRRVNPV